MKIIKTSVVILWMIIIFLLSNQKASDSTKLSNGLILNVVNIIENINHKDYSDEEILNKFVKPVRKMAHFTIYLILGILVFIALDEYNLKNIAIISLLICILYSCSDEMHQLFIDGRSGELLDIIIDSMGSFIGINIVKVGFKNEKNK